MARPAPNSNENSANALSSTACVRIVSMTRSTGDASALGPRNCAKIEMRNSITMLMAMTPNRAMPRSTSMASIRSAEVVGLGSAALLENISNSNCSSANSAAGSGGADSGAFGLRRPLGDAVRPHSLSLLAQRRNPASLCGDSLDCLVASASRNDGVAQVSVSTDRISSSASFSRRLQQRPQRADVRHSLDLIHRLHQLLALLPPHHRRNEVSRLVDDLFPRHRIARGAADGGDAFGEAASIGKLDL